MPTRYLTILIYIAAISLLSSCHKSSSGPNTANSYNYPISGVAYIKTNYNNGSDSVLLRNKPVFIDTTFGMDTGSHFYSLPTGPDGSFIFYVPDTTRKYRIFTACYDTASSAFIPPYYGAVITSQPYATNPVYELTATIDTLNSNGMIICTVDKNRNIIPRVNVILYTSAIIAGQDSAYSGAQAFRQLTTDSLGKAFLAAVPGDSLYESAKVMISARDSIILHDSAIKVPPTGIFYDTLILH
jgi:hypothetical protein